MSEKPTICAECNHAICTSLSRELWQCGANIVELDVITGQEKGRLCVDLNKGACEKFFQVTPLNIQFPMTTSTGKLSDPWTYVDAYSKHRLEILPL